MHLGGLAMGLTKYKLGELIELVLKTNSELRYGPDDVRGMTITKEIIPTKADVTGTDLSKFLVVSPGEFIYNPRTHGKRIGFGYNNTGDTFIISWNNIAFKVKTSMKDVVLADYLFLHFNCFFILSLFSTFLFSDICSTCACVRLHHFACC